MPTVLILGASRGIGHEMVRQYKQDGWRVIATARKQEDCDALVRMGAEAHPLDVTNADSIADGDAKLDTIAKRPPVSPSANPCEAGYFGLKHFVQHTAPNSKNDQESFQDLNIQILHLIPVIPHHFIIRHRKHFENQN